MTEGSGLSGSAVQWFWWQCGNFQTPALGALRETAAAALGSNPGALAGPMTVTSAWGDVRYPTLTL